MRGKFTQLATWAEVHAFSQPLMVRSGEEVVVSTPMRFAKILRLNAAGKRELVPMRWGFAKKMVWRPRAPDTCTLAPRPSTSSRLRAGVRGKTRYPDDAHLQRRRRASQWQDEAVGGYAEDGQPIAIAVIFETWRNGTESLDTFVQITTPANSLISRITDRMPVILPA